MSDISLFTGTVEAPISFHGAFIVPHYETDYFRELRCMVVICFYYLIFHISEPIYIMYHVSTTVGFYNKLISNITEETTLFNFKII